MRTATVSTTTATMPYRAHGHIHGVLDPTVPTTDRGIWAIKWSFLILAVTAILQLIVVFVSHSVALFADTIHNIADAGTAIPLWIAFVLARRKADADLHLWLRQGRGLRRSRDRPDHSVQRNGRWVMRPLTGLFRPREVMHLGWLAAAGVIGFLGNEAVAVFRIRIGRQINSAALIADGYHARTDGLTSLAVVLGAFGVWMGYALADPSLASS